MVVPFMFAIVLSAALVWLMCHFIANSIVVIALSFVVALVAVFYIVFDRNERARVIELIVSRIPVKHQKSNE